MWGSVLLTLESLDIYFFMLRMEKHVPYNQFSLWAIFAIFATLHLIKESEISVWWGFTLPQLNYFTWLIWFGHLTLTTLIHYFIFCNVDTLKAFFFGIMGKFLLYFPNCGKPMQSDEHILKGGAKKHVLKFFEKIFAWMQNLRAKNACHEEGLNLGPKKMEKNVNVEKLCFHKILLFLLCFFSSALLDFWTHNQVIRNLSLSTLKKFHYFLREKNQKNK